MACLICLDEIEQTITCQACHKVTCMPCIERTILEDPVLSRCFCCAECHAFLGFVPICAASKIVRDRWWQRQVDHVATHQDTTLIPIAREYCLRVAAVKRVRHVVGIVKIRRAVARDYYCHMPFNWRTRLPYKRRAPLVRTCAHCQAMAFRNNRCSACRIRVCGQCDLFYKTRHVCDPKNVQSKAASNLISKPCPGCGIHTEHTGGCQSMYCARCKISYHYKTGIIQQTQEQAIEIELLEVPAQPSLNAIIPRDLHGGLGVASQCTFIKELHDMLHRLTLSKSHPYSAIHFSWIRQLRERLAKLGNTRTKKKVSVALQNEVFGSTNRVLQRRFLLATLDELIGKINHIWLGEEDDVNTKKARICEEVSRLRCFHKIISTTSVESHHVRCMKALRKLGRRAKYYHMYYLAEDRLRHH